MIQLHRNALPDLARCSHAGLILTRGLRYYPEDNDAGRIKSQLIERLCQVHPDSVYRHAFKRWRQASSGPRFSTVTAAVADRLYIGVTRENALAAGVTLHHIYGMPIIAGSSVKGLCQTYAMEMQINANLCRWLFGSPPEDDADAETAEGGAVAFHDALWIPEQDGSPFVLEIITPHHQEYYDQGKLSATDFDSPNPVPQVAVRGKFYFAIEGDAEATALAAAILKQALEIRGIGGRRSSGYGLFSDFAVIYAPELVLAEKKRENEEQARRQAREAARLQEELWEKASPIKREMLNQGYDDKPEKFESEISKWVRRMDAGGDESKEIAALLKEWFFRHKRDEWLKGGISKKSKEKIKAIRAMLGNN